MGEFQTTIEQEVLFEGVGLHTGSYARLRLSPAPENTGIVFVDSDNKPLFPATLESVIGTEYCVTLGNSDISVKTVEHLLSALMALPITNVFIHCDGPEIPVMDGSSWPFFFHLRASGVKTQQAPRSYAYVTKEVSISVGQAHAIVRPSHLYHIAVELQYTHPFLMQEGLRRDFVLETHAYEREIARARTYGFTAHQAFYQQQGLAKGASPDNVLVFDDQGPVSTEPPRMPQEIVRHKILDVVGDLSLIGAPLIGSYQATCPGHTINTAIGRALLSQDALRWVSWDEACALSAQEASM